MWTQKRIQKQLCLGLGFLALTLAMPAAKSLPPRSEQLPTPEAAAQQAESLSPEELTRQEVDEVTRDRLRFDPNWQPILRAIRQDLMVIKWGDGKLENPAWKQYGAKAYPLLNYYARSGDPTRQQYGIVGIRSLGKPYTTLWLKQQLQRRSLDDPDFYYLTSDPKSLLEGSYDPKYDAKTWEKEFGLDDAKTRSDLIQLAKRNLEPQNSPTYYDQFNLAFLSNLLGYGALETRQPSPSDSQMLIPLNPWLNWERMSQPARKDIDAAIAFYRKLPSESQEYLLVKHLGDFKAGKIPPVGRELLRSLAAEPDSPNRTWAIAELERHGDANATTQLVQMLNRDLSQLHSLTRSASYEDDSDRGSHAYYLLVNIVQKYPQSRFVQGCKEYGDLTGKSYFGEEPRNKAILDRNAKKTAAERVKDWQAWLSRYPDHPGADDATYHLARSLQDQNDVLGAMRLWINMMTHPMGDRDALYLAWGHVRTMLDVGLTSEQLQTLLKEPESASIAPLLQYTLAVRYARKQDYTQALQISETLDLTQMSPQVLGSYYNSNLWVWWFRENKPAELQKQMQAFLQDQRQRWQQLQHWQQENTPTDRYQMATHWANSGGWKNGYLPVWNDFRISLLPTGSWSTYYCQVYWACNTELREAESIRAAYQPASQNAIALSLYQAVLTDTRTPPELREKTLYMVAMTLLHQWENYPEGETMRIHPPVGVATSPQPLETNFDRDYRNWDRLQNRIQQDYQSRIDSILTELQVKFPKSIYIDDLLFSSYYLSGQSRYLQQLIERYPQSDRADEARFLLTHARK
ncbi:MAG: hypothetical protein KME16_24130 [Scytolyngbya sp. HA4215-MV1]|jgi:hypothetical protein|nr:hypothetical protein [Scytolyngbya sp. HA4215-MV1]